MTEGEWLGSTDPLSMLDFLVNNGRASDRKLRLFAVACCRRIWDFLDDLGRGAVEMAALFADGQAGAEEQFEDAIGSVISSEVRANQWKPVRRIPYRWR